MNPARTLLLAWLAAAGVTAPTDAGDWTLSGSASGELRWFAEAPSSANQLEDDQVSVAVAPEWRWRSDDKKHRVTLAPWARWDAEDDERTHFDLREAWWRVTTDDWDLQLGVDRVFWGVAESRHLVDVINQTDAVEDLDGEDRLGQPMIRLGFDRSWGRVEVLTLLGFRERTFPGLDGRLRAPLVVDTDATRYESGAEDRRIDLALRWSHYLGDWDLGAHVFHGTGRAPRLVPTAEGTLVPVYDVVNQLGVDIQSTRGAWLWKAEALVREGQGQTFGAAVAGFEVTLYQLADSAADLGLLAELHWDDRDVSAPFTIYDEDTFVGARLALNDAQDTSALAGVLVDHDDGSLAVTLEAERRFGQTWTLEIEGRWFTNVDPGSDLAALAQDDVITLRGSWHF